MPTPATGESQDDFMHRCVPMLLDEGKDQDQAVAQCISMFENKDGKSYWLDDKGTIGRHQEPKPLTRAWSTFQIKSFDDDLRTIEGIASTPATDRMDDIVEPMGAKFKLPLPLMWEHGKGFTKDPVGWVQYAEPQENGIPIRARFAKVDRPQSLKEDLDRAWSLVKSGLVRGLSIGFTARESGVESIKGSWGLRYKEWEWIELSAVAIPANAEANITTIKSIDQAQLAVFREKRPVVRLDSKSTSAGVPALTRRPPPMPIPLAEQITSFEKKHGATEARIASIMDKAGEEGRTLTEAEEQEHDALKLEVKSIETHIARLKEHDARLKAKAVAVVPPNGHEQGTQLRSSSPIQVTSQLPKGTMFTRYCIAMMLNKGMMHEAAAYAEKRWKDTPEIAHILRDGGMSGQIQKAAVDSADTTTSGWALQIVPNAQLLGSEFIDLLRPATLLGRIPGIRRVPFNVAVPVQSGGGTYGWVGEAQGKGVTKLTFAQATLRWAKVAAIMVFTQELARQSSPSAESLIRNDMVKGMANYIDTQFVDPAIAGVSNVQPASITNGITGNGAGGTTAAAFRADWMETMSKIAGNNQNPGDFVVAMSASVATNLSILVNSLSSGPEFPQMTPTGGSIYGTPVIVSQSVGARIIFLNPAEILLADDGGVDISVSDQATVEMDSTPAIGEQSPVSDISNMKSFWQYNLVGLRCERFITWVRARTSSVEYIYNAVYSG